MANQLDVAARLAEGRPAVEHTQTYVCACHVLGYQHPDLTMHPSQIRELYDSEDGLDLWVLDDDCAKLRAAANATDEALSRQRAQLTQLAAAWNGRGADSALDFLQRHCRVGEGVATAVRAAAERCAALRDNLWQLIDRKVATAIAIDDRELTERPAWLAAAQTVTTRAADWSVADELVERQIKPYVDNDIRADWITAMREAVASVDASFDAVSDAFAAAPPARFELPGGFVPRCPAFEQPPTPIAGPLAVPVAPANAHATPPVDPAAAAPSAAVPAASADLGPTPPTFPAGTFDGLPPLPPLLDAPLGSGAAPPMGAGDLGGASGLGGLSGLGGSIGSVVGQIVGGIGDLLGSLADGLGDPAVTDDAPVNDELDPDDPDEDAADEDVDDDADGEPDDEDAEPADADEGAEAATSGTPGESPPASGGVIDDPSAAELPAPPADGAPPAAAPPPAEPSPPPADPGSDESSPCEIAADELPQAGQ